ncbi:MAG TPA: serine hydrolase [Candidatus Paceibacterota bacterium]|nr:serine hydrolase [Candidatus Paceibacterota bacterium]
MFAGTRRALIIRIISYILIFLVGWGTALLVRQATDRQVTSSREYRSRGVLTSPLLECDSDSLQARVLFGNFWQNIQPAIDKWQTTPGITDVAVYFRDMTNGPWFGDNEGMPFSPASLLKVPIMMSYLHWAEDDPSLLREKLEFLTGTAQYPQNVPPAEDLKPHEKYTADELIARMIEDSDNAAAATLVNHLGQDRLNATFEALGVSVPNPGQTEDFMSVKDYASFFRILYNASYLDEEMSERALEYLTRSTYTDGLVAGVPVGTVVAHKFGERALEGGAATSQLHDCGIVYYPKRPYLICVMTRGSDRDNMTSAIREISAAVYAGVKERVTASSE